MFNNILPSLLYILPLISLAISSLQIYKSGVKSNEKMLNEISILREDVKELKRDWKSDHDALVRTISRLDAAWRILDNLPFKGEVKVYE